MFDPPPETRNPLLIPDLFQCILDWFFIPEEDPVPLYPHRITQADLRVAQRAMAALARTCRATSEPSLDRLWQRLESIDPLIRCFSPSAKTDRLNGPPSSAEWEIINRYSHRVRGLTLHSLIGDLFLHDASNYSQSPFLFPNLRALKFSVPIISADSDLTETMHRILSPTLVSLSTALCRAQPGVDSFLQNYPLLCPGLKFVEIEICQSFFHPENGSTWEIPKLSQAICTHKHLESLKLSLPIDGVALGHVMLSPQLRVVSLVLHSMEPNLGNIGITSADIPFRNVKELELFVWDFQFVPRLLRPQDQKFQAFFLHVTGLHDAKTISSLMTALASPQRTESLQSIHLTLSDSHAPYDEYYDPVYNNSAHHYLTYDIFRPLTSFKHLRQLVILLVNHTVLEDEELVNLARNWPVLEAIELNGNNGNGHRVKSITLGGLLSLLMLCPRLHDLRLSIDARDVPMKTSMDVCENKIPILRLPDSPIRDARLVADFFAKCIPSVAFIDVDFAPIPPVSPYRPLEDYELLWDEVNEYLQGEGD